MSKKYTISYELWEKIYLFLFAGMGILMYFFPIVKGYYNGFDLLSFNNPMHVAMVRYTIPVLSWCQIVFSVIGLIFLISSILRDGEISIVLYTFIIVYTIISTLIYAIYGLIGVFMIGANGVTTLAFIPLLICIALLVINKLVKDWLVG